MSEGELYTVETILDKREGKKKGIDAVIKGNFSTWSSGKDGMLRIPHGNLNPI